MSTIGLNFNKFDVRYRGLIRKAVERMEIVINLPVFFSMLEDEIVNSKGLEGELSEFKNASVVEIHKALFPIVLYLNTYYTISKVIGYGTAKDNQIFLNTKYLSKYFIDDEIHLMKVGSNLLHEHGHDCGFAHDYRATARRPNSLCYILNRAYERAYRCAYELPAPMTIPYTPWYKRLWRWIS
jgi:hypothetical protein